jgi:hypothetical protein
VKAKLWEVIEGLARMHVFLYNTNHFSDRELYAHLWQESLREIMRFPDFGESATCYLDLVSSGSEEDIECWLCYYASEDTRAQWQKDFPDDVLPPRERPPYDRDRLLPRAPHDKRE